MLCNHCSICRSLGKCTKIRHACQIREFIGHEAAKDIRPVKWKIEGRK